MQSCPGPHPNSPGRGAEKQGVLSPAGRTLLWAWTGTPGDVPAARAAQQHNSNQTPGGHHSPWTGPFSSRTTALQSQSPREVTLVVPAPLTGQVARGAGPGAPQGPTRVFKRSLCPGAHSGSAAAVRVGARRCSEGGHAGCRAPFQETGVGHKGRGGPGVGEAPGGD